MNLFFNWLNNKNNTKLSETQKNEFIELERIWNISSDHKKVEIPDAEKEWEDLEPKLNNKDVPTRSVKLSPAWYYAAASIILLLGTWSVFSFLTTDIYRSQNELQTVFLPDSSEVLLNKHSRLRVKFSFNEKHRNVDLHGEAYFKVKKGQLPFIIKTTEANVKVVGTEFNVKSRLNKTEVGVNEGIVDFFPSRKNFMDTIRLTRGEYSTCSKKASPEKAKKIVFDEYPAWIKGKLAFQDASIKEICREIEIKFNTTIKIETPAIKEMQISGMFEGKNPEEILTALCTLIKREFRKEGETYVLY